MKIIGFCQIRNELQNGNLHNLLKGMEFCEKIYIFDQASNDGSHEVYAQHDNVEVIQSEVNRFVDDGPRRLASPKEFIERSFPQIPTILKDNPDTDWLCWLDGGFCARGQVVSEQRSRTKTATATMWRFRVQGDVFAKFQHVEKQQALQAG